MSTLLTKYLFKMHFQGEIFKQGKVVTIKGNRQIEKIHMPICTDGSKNLHTLLVKHYNDLLDRQSF